MTLVTFASSQLPFASERGSQPKAKWPTGSPMGTLELAAVFRLRPDMDGGGFAAELNVSAGQGLNVILEDGAVLAWHLQQSGLSPESLRAFEKERIPRLAKMVGQDEVGFVHCWRFASGPFPVPCLKLCILRIRSCKRLRRRY